jgi:hypothetical protein
MATKNISVPVAVSGGLERQRRRNRSAARPANFDGPVRRADGVVPGVEYIVNSFNVAIVNIG